MFAFKFEVRTIKCHYKNKIVLQTNSYFT